VPQNAHAPAQIWRRTSNIWSASAPPTVTLYKNCDGGSRLFDAIRCQVHVHDHSVGMILGLTGDSPSHDTNFHHIFTRAVSNTDAFQSVLRTGRDQLIARSASPLRYGRLRKAPELLHGSTGFRHVLASRATRRPDGQSHSLGGRIISETMAVRASNSPWLAVVGESAQPGHGPRQTWA
jgi:hypothetical protein